MNVMPKLMKKSQHDAIVRKMRKTIRQLEKDVAYHVRQEDLSNKDMLVFRCCCIDILNTTITAIGKNDLNVGKAWLVQRLSKALAKAGRFDLSFL